MLRYSEPITEVMPERDAELGAGVHQTEKGVAAIAPDVAVRSAADLSLDDMTANVAFGTVGMQRDFRPVEHGEQLGLVGVQPLQQTIERDEAGAATEDAIEPGTHLAAPLRGRRRTVGLQISVEPPDERADALLRDAVQIGEGVKLVDQPLGMDPTQRMPSDGELTGIITDHDSVMQEAVRVNAAPQRALGGDLHRVWGDPQSADAEAVEMSLPGGLVGEVPLWLSCQLADDRSGQCAATHIVQGHVVDHIVSVTGTQQIKEIQPALAGSGTEPGEAAVADLRTEAILAGVPRTGVVHCDPGRSAQAGAQHLAVLA